MKKSIYILSVLFALLLTVPCQAQSNQRESELSSPMHNMVIPKGNGLFTIKVPVYIGSAWGNYWASQNGKCLIFMEVEGEKYNLLNFKASDYANDSGTANIVYVCVDRDNKDLGLCVFKDIDGSRIEQHGGTGEWLPLRVRMTKSADSEYNMTFLEFDWQGNSKLFDGKDINFEVYFNFAKFWGEDYMGGVELGSFTFSSNLIPPIIAGAYLDPNAAEGYEGQVNVSAASSETPETVAIIVNGKPYNRFTSTSNSIEFTLGQCDTTRVVQVEATYNRNGLTATLRSEPYTILPYHKIKETHVSEQHTPVPSDSCGYKRLTWSIDTTNSTDMFSTDYFIIERAAKPDMSDAEKIASVSMTDTLSAGQYAYVDKAREAVFNEAGYQKTYYRIYRASADGLYIGTDHCFSVPDSVENTVGYQPKVTAVEPVEDEDYKFNRKVNVKIHFGLADHWDEQNQCYRAKWNDKAKVKLYITRRDFFNTLLGSDSLEVDTKGVQFDEKAKEYVLTHEYVLTEPGAMIYYFKAKAMRSEIAPNMIFAHNNDSPTEDAGKEKNIFLNNLDITPVRNVKATQGTEYGFVRINWEAPASRFDKIEVLRRQGDGKWSVLAAIDPSATYYEDRTAELGERYEYAIRIKVTYQTNTGEATSTEEDGYTPAIGWISPVGRIAGKVATAQGSGIAAQTVELLRDGKRVAETVTNDDGTFVFDNVEIATDAMTYLVQVPSEKLEFTYNGEKAGASIALSARNSAVADINFVCISVARFTGRVMFEHSTVPVSGAMFRINGEVVHGSNNQPVKTDNDGNFEIYVPRQQVTVQVFKPGHRFVNDGYVLDKDRDVRQFTPDGDYNALTLFDQTKVLLRGRIVGGNTLAALPLGQGLTKNNLGDNITLQLKLEGNNTANFVFLKDNPDKDSLTVYNTQQWQGETVTRTRGDFFRKQIDIHVDNATGEYAMELFPTKYKVTQAFAQGYASLFANGEVAQVLDLTDSVGVDSTQTTLATYSITYHSDVNLTYRQLLYGVTELPYLGAEKLDEINIYGDKLDAKLYYEDDNDNVHYLLGAPLFRTGELYFLRGTAHEDYYYNNVPTGAHYQELIHNGTVRVENGLAAQNPEIQTFTLDDKGQFTFKFIANNDNFALSGEDALRQLVSSIEINGLYYQSQPLKAFVTGQRTKEGGIYTAKDAKIDLLDILRDPVGGYSYYGKGKQYSMSRNFNFTVSAGMKLDISAGVNYNAIVGVINGGTVLTATSSQGGSTYQTSVSIPLGGLNLKRATQYNFTSMESIQTSSDPLDNGAMADVYIGATTDYVCIIKQSICVIDDKTYKAMKPSIDAGLIKVIQKGEQPDGTAYYLVSAEQIQPGYYVPSTFAYSQKHIITNIIPQLFSLRNSLLYGGEGVTKEMVEQIAKQSGNTVYYYKGNSKAEAAVGEIGIDYEPCYPNEQAALVHKDKIDLYNKQIKTWVNMICLNEELKVKAAQNPEVTNYSLSAGQKVSYSEDISYRDTGVKFTGSLFGFALNGLYADRVNAKNCAEIANKVFNMVSPVDAGSANWGNQGNTQFDFVTSFYQLFKQGDEIEKVNTTAFETPTSKISFKITPLINLDYSDNTDGAKQTSFKSGYEIELKDDSYANISVYKALASTLGEAYEQMKEAHDFTTGSSDDSELLHQYIFAVNGGAMRNPWCDADSTIFYNPGTPLGVRPLKIDNPVMTLSTTEISNVPEDEKAVFSLRLTNDSELSGGQTVTHPSMFTLMLVDQSNPNGAKVYIDGMPLVGGRSFLIEPGESLNKTVEVARGVGYDFENLQLKFASADYSNINLANFSVHFQHSSSSVKVSSPTDKWVMNTFSARDSIGYYIPVVVEGYDINYNNFDHIELQYKKSTEGDANWVNLCSYYANDSLYNAASGTKSKEQIRTGKITHTFYGEKDPIEMKYDIRAVTFCRLGTGYVTRASNVISGTKDTRRPTVFGQSQPLNGILTADNDIMLPFSEPIAYNYLDETANFDIRGYLNSDNIDTNVGLVFNGDARQDAYTEVTRNLSHRNFTIDMLVKPDEDEKEMTFFSHGVSDDETTFTFGINNNRQLFVDCCGKNVLSVPLKEPVNQSFTHVGAIYNMPTDEESEPYIRFFVGNTFIDVEDGDDTVPLYSGNAPIHFGTCIDKTATGFSQFKGRMLEARLWNQALDADMISEFNNKMLDGYCSRIIGYWPMRQTTGNATDRACGADLRLDRVNWYTSDGYSLAINEKAIQLDGAPFARNANLDYTLSFWMRLHEAAANSQVFSAGNDNMSEQGKGKLRIGFRDGKFVVVTNGNTIATSHDLAQLVDDQWHHFALSVSHSQNIAHVFIDDKPVAQVQGDSVDGITMESVWLGSDNLTANIDQLCFWHQALPQNFIDHLKDYCIEGDEMGLWVYLPFDHTEESNQGTTSIRFTAQNMAKVNKEGFKKEMTQDLDEETDVAHICAPVLAHLPLSKYKFNWSSDGTKLLINLDMKNSQIDKNNIFITVRDVEDTNGNTMANPYSWVVYADLGTLRWDTDHQRIDIGQGHGYTDEIAWRNITANRTNYLISASSPYITIDDQQGVAAPGKTYSLTYTISGDMTPGHHTEYIWLEDLDNAMTSTFTLDINITPNTPDWTIDRKKYDQTMSLMASVSKRTKGVEYRVTDPRDMVGIFCNSECVGVGNIQDEGTAQLYLTVYGNAATEGKSLTFYLFDYSTGNVTMLTADQEVRFQTGGNIGMPPAAPLKLVTSDTKMQNIRLNEGWNWISLNVSPANASLANNAILNNGVFTGGDIFKNDAQHAEYSAAQNRWMLDDIQLSHKKVYHVYANKATEFSIVGSELTARKRFIQIKHGWNELPYHLDHSLPINRAMADYQNHDKATEGDIIKGHDSFAVLTNDYSWVGTLKQLNPNAGYYLLHNGSNDTEIIIDNDLLSTVNSQSAASQQSIVNSQSVASQQSEQSMIVIAALAEDEGFAADAVVEVNCGLNAVSKAEPITLPDGTKRYFISVPGTGAAVQFVVKDENDQPVQAGTLPFNGTTCIGTLDKPYVLSSQNDGEEGDYYDISGRPTTITNSRGHKVYVTKGKKVAK